MSSVVPLMTFPCLSYRDAPAAIEWLCSVFGFERHAVHAAADGTIAQAELRYGHGMIMLASLKDTEYGRLIRQPADLGGFVTQSVYLTTADPDGLHAKATAAAAEMIIELRNEPYGSRGFTCRDPEGHVWAIGTYDPLPR
jgi:uncharacterized glyoxalase superfamily protein PhnB